MARFVPHRPGPVGVRIPSVSRYSADPTTTDSGSGTLTLSGAQTSALLTTGTGSGTLTLSGSSSHVLTFSGSGPGVLTLSGSSTNLFSFTAAPTGTLTLSGDYFQTSYSYATSTSRALLGVG